MDYAGNEVYVLNLTAESPAWVREVNPSTNVQQNVGYYADGKPTSRHGGADQCFIPAGITNGNRRFAPHGVAVYGGATPPTNKAASYVPGSGAYDPQNTFPDFPGNNGNAYEGCTAWDSGSNLVWVKEANDSSSGGVYSLNPATKAWSSRYGMWGLGSDQAMGVIK